MPFTTAGELIAAKRQPLVSVEPGATARAAVRVMEEKDIGFLPVLDGEKLVGVVSERDIASGVIHALPHNGAVITLRHGPHAQGLLPRHLRDHAAQDRCRGSGDRRVLPDGDLLSMGNRIDVLPEVLTAIDLHQRARLFPAQARAHHERRES